MVQYPKRQVGNKVYGGQSSHLPLKINTAGVIPVIFASSILLLPNTMSGFGAGSSSDIFLMITSYLGRGQPLYLAIFAFMIIFFAFFYTGIVFNPDETADNLKKNGKHLNDRRVSRQCPPYSSKNNILPNMSMKKYSFRKLKRVYRYSWVSNKRAAWNNCTG